MTHTKSTGAFITFEGLDGCGKTTILNRVKKHLEKKGYEVVTTREPGGTEIGDSIRSYIMNNKNLPAISELLLFEANRTVLINNIIKPALLSNKIVLCDRFIDSTVAYQAYGNKIDKNIVDFMNQCAVQNIFYPEMSIYIHTDENIRNKRINRRSEKNRYDDKSNEYFENVRKGYEESDYIKNALDFNNSLPIEQSQIDMKIADQIDKYVQAKIKIIQDHGLSLNKYMHAIFDKESMSNSNKSPIKRVDCILEGPYEERYKLTEKGKKKVEEFIKKCNDIRNEILKNKEDTVNETVLPTEEDILRDISDWIENGEYRNAWRITDNYNSDILVLKQGEDFLEVDSKTKINSAKEIEDLEK